MNSTRWDDKIKIVALLLISSIKNGKDGFAKPFRHCLEVLNKHFAVGCLSNNT